MEDLHPLPSDPSILAHIVDAHCHPTDSTISLSAISALPHRICAMATRASDQALVRDLATQYPDRVIPCFGYHPWFTHWISLHPPSAVPPKATHYAALFLPTAAAQNPNPNPNPNHAAAFDRLLPFLPEPTSLDTVLADLRANLTSFPTAMLGEVGLDRVCRVPYAHPAPPPYAAAYSDSTARTPGGSDAQEPGRALSPFTIPLAHQLAVLEAQLALAVDLRRNVSMHSVKAQNATIELLARMRARHGRRWDDISVDLHACGVSVEGWLEIEKAHPNVFLSLSTPINARSPAHVALLGAAAPTRFLVESDFNDAARSAAYTWDMVCRVASARGWWLERSGGEVESGGREGEEGWGAVRRIEENWRSFERGGHRMVPGKKQRDRRKLLLDESEEESDEEERT